MAHTKQHDPKQYVMENIAPPMGAMLVCILGAFLVYKGFYDGAYTPAKTRDIAAIAPAAGDTFTSNGTEYRVIDTNDIAVWHGTIGHSY